MRLPANSQRMQKRPRLRCCALLEHAAHDQAAQGHADHNTTEHGHDEHEHVEPAPAEPVAAVETSHADLFAATEHVAAEDVSAEPAAAEPAPVAKGKKPQPNQCRHSLRTHARSDANGEPGLPNEEIRREWYILKVQSNREDSIRDGLLRRVKMAGLERFFGTPLEQSCIVPTEMITEFKGGKKRVSKRKLYPGYLVVKMMLTDDTWYLVRETTGIGDFTGSIGRPSPMLPQDVQKILAKTEEKTDEAPKLKISFKKGDRVKINEGTFENFEGDVDTIDEANGRVVVMINIFGRSTPVELEYWQIEVI